jgi:hypothetical protein
MLGEAGKKTLSLRGNSSTPFGAAAFRLPFRPPGCLKGTASELEEGFGRRTRCRIVAAVKRLQGFLVI